MFVRRFLCALAVMPAFAVALEPLQDADLSEETGRQGIAMFIDFRINADALGQPLTAPATTANPAAFANCGSLSDFSSTGCRLAVKFANRNDNGGEWLVAKNIYGRINIPLMHIGAGYNPTTATPYENLDRFKDESGAPQIASPHGSAALQVSFPQEIELWNVTVGGFGIEYGATGYMNNDKPSFGGIKISNSSPNMPALINAQGTMSIYGF